MSEIATVVNVPYRNEFGPLVGWQRLQDVDWRGAAVYYHPVWRELAWEESAECLIALPPDIEWAFFDLLQAGMVRVAA
jgi:hypothetical protein